MRIAVHAKVLSEANLNGIGVYTLNLLKAISILERKNEYVLFSNKPIIQKIGMPNFNEKILNFPRLWTYLRMPFEFIGGRYDILFVPKADLPPFKRPKTICVFYGFGRYIVKEDKLTTVHRLHIWTATNYALKSADHIIAISNSARNELIETYGFNPSKITMTHLGYDRELYRPCNDPDIIKKICHKHRITGKYIINTSSVLWHRKNLLRLIYAFKEFKGRTGAGQQLVITGKKGETYEEIVRLVSSSETLKNSVIITDYIPKEDMPILLSGADCMVFPSLYEGFGLSVLEAMACGCPVITSNISSLPEVVGDAGILIDPYSISEISSSIEKVVFDLEAAKRMCENGMERARKFTWENTARLTLKVFEKIAGS
jgi:glycosyltransferase involved in cell wall biosynthesis